jgi:hypothetical protein
MANPDISYFLGGTGYQPVSPGHWPGETERGSRKKKLSRARKKLFIQGA